MKKVEENAKVSDSLNLENILKKHTASQKEQDDILMLDVDEYLNKVKSEQKEVTTEDTTHNESIKHTTVDRDEVTSEYSISQPGKSKRLSTSSTKAPLFGKGKKAMQEFMKNKLAKTKQSGQDGVFLVGKLPIKLKFVDPIYGNNSIYI